MSVPGASGASLHRTASGAALETWAMGAHHVALRWSPRGGLEVAVHGHGHAEFAHVAVRRKDALTEPSNRITLFYDLSQMASYDSVMRVEWTKWIASHIKLVDAVHVVATSKLVTMGVAVANLALGGILQTYPQREGGFADALARTGITSR